MRGRGDCRIYSIGWSSSQQYSGTLESVLKQLDIQAGDFHSLTADLERTKVTVVVNDKSTESGKIFVRRDDKMRIELTQPDPRTILRDGNDFYIYNPKIHRVEEYNLGKKKSLVDQFLLLGFGTPGSDLKKSYSITLQGEESLDNRKVVLLELLPKSDDVRNQLSKIQLWIDRNQTTCETNSRKSSCGSTNPHGFRRSRSFSRPAPATILSSSIRTSRGTSGFPTRNSSPTGRMEPRE